MVEINTDVSTVVIAGSWNKHIFTEEWVVNNLLIGEEKIKVEYPVNFDGSLRFTAREISFCILGNRLIFTSSSASEPNYCQIIEVLRNLLRLLSHTPVFAIGFNFIFESSLDLSIFDSLDDSATLSECIGKETSSQSIKRTFEFSNNHSLNIAITKNSGAKTKFDFNFDYKVKKTIDIVNVLGDDNDIIAKKRKEAIDIMSTVYKETI